jgi:GGDEF domain-containing protein
MKHLRRSIVALLIELIIFFNIERLDLGHENSIDIQSFVYVLVLAAVIVTLLVPQLRRAPVTLSLGLWAIIYIIAKLQPFSTRPLIGGISTYITTTELLLLLLAIWLAHAVSRHMLEFEAAVENITLSGNGNRVRGVREMDEAIETEIMRSRRYARPLTVAVLEADPSTLQDALHQTVKDVQQAMMGRYVLTRLARTLGDDLRRTDLVLENFDRSRLIILSPETRLEDTGWLHDRVQSIQQELGIRLTLGIASFPDQALTFEDLVEQAELQLRQASPEQPAQAEEPQETLLATLD